MAPIPGAAGAAAAVLVLREIIWKQRKIANSCFVT